MRRDGTWGDDIEIRALEEILDRRVDIYSATDDPALPIAPLPTAFGDGDDDNADDGCGVGGDGDGDGDDRQPIRLSYHGQSHYNSVEACAALHVALGELHTTRIVEARVAAHNKVATPQKGGTLRRLFSTGGLFGGGSSGRVVPVS